MCPTTLLTENAKLQDNTNIWYMSTPKGRCQGASAVDNLFCFCFLSINGRSAYDEAGVMLRILCTIVDMTFISGYVDALMSN